MPFRFSLSNIYSKTKQALSDVFSPIKQGVNLLKQGKDYLHEQFNKLSSIPYVGDMLQAEADKVAETPFIFGFSPNDVGRFIDVASSYVNSPHINEWTSRIDNVVSPLLSSADAALARSS